MGISFDHTRDVDVADVPEADPNTTPPPDADIFKLKARLPNAELGVAERFKFYGFSTTTPAPSPGTFNWQLWLRDGGLDRWFPIASAAAVAQDALQPSPTFPPGADLFLQITGTTIAADAIRLRGTEAPA